MKVSKHRGTKVPLLFPGGRLSSPLRIRGSVYHVSRVTTAEQGNI